MKIRIPLIPRRIQDGNGLKNDTDEEDNDNDYDNERNKPVADHKEVIQTDFDFFVTWTESLAPGMAVILLMIFMMLTIIIIMVRVPIMVMLLMTMMMLTPFQLSLMNFQASIRVQGFGFASSIGTPCFGAI